MKIDQDLTQASKMNVSTCNRKIVVIGEQNVGKTCILQRLIDNTFNPNTPPTISNSTSKFSCTLSNGKEVTLTIWDTAGQEKYRSLTNVYFRDSQAAVIVFDASNKNPKPEIQQWVDSYRNVVGPKCYIIVAANKSDLIPDKQGFRSRLHDLEEELKDIPVNIVSAKDGEGIQELFEHVAYKVSEIVQEAPVIEFSEQKKGCC